MVIRNHRILMVKHRQNGEEWLCLPGGAVEPGETSESAALRELLEECCVQGRIVRKTSEYADLFADGCTVTFLADIGDQAPVLGEDPEIAGDAILVDTGWFALSEICEQDRAFLWAAGLVAVDEFADELQSWSREVSYPAKRKD